MTRTTFAIPTVIAVLTLGGLIIALMGQGWRDAAAWFGLSTSLLAIGWALRPARTIRKD